MIFYWIMDLKRCARRPGGGRPEGSLDIYVYIYVYILIYTYKNNIYIYICISMYVYNLLIRGVLYLKVMDADGGREEIGSLGL